MSQRRRRGFAVPAPLHPKPVSVAESTATVDRPRHRMAVRETPTVIEAPSKAKPGRMKIRLIKAGWSLNDAHYSAAMLKRDGPRAWPAGTQCFVDHDTDADEEARPAGSVKNLAAVLTTDAQWNTTTQSLEAEVRLFAPWREAITDMAEHIGMSIRAWVYGEHGEAEGRKGFIVQSIAEGRSVDFVTVPAAGGAILSVLESVRHRRAEARNIGAWLESRLHLALTQLGDDMYGDGRLTRDERIVLSGAIGDALTAWSARVEADAPQLFERDLYTYPELATSPAEETRRAAEATAEETRTALQQAIRVAYGTTDETYAWVRDFDPDQSLVWFDTSADGEDATWQQAYSAAGGGQATLTGERQRVVARVVYDPVSDDTAEAALISPPPTATAVTENVTDGAPPTGSPNPSEEDPDMSGTQAGDQPDEAGTAPVVNPPDPNQPANPPTPPAPDTPEQPAPQPASDPAVATVLESLTRQLAAMNERFTASEQRAATERAEAQRLRNQHTARDAVAQALATDTVPADLRAQIGPRVTAAVLADIPTAEGGDVDSARLSDAVTAAITAESTYVAALLESRGVGVPRGLGEAPKPQTGDEFIASLEENFVALGMTPTAAKIAARGRG